MLGLNRQARVREALRQLEAQGAADYESLLAERAAKEEAPGRKLAGRKPSSQGQRAKERLANTTDPTRACCGLTTASPRAVNAQAAVAADQVIVAAELTSPSADTTMFAPRWAMRARRTSPPPAPERPLRRAPPVGR